MGLAVLAVNGLKSWT